jgi:ATP-binding cassette subfamily B protein
MAKRQTDDDLADVRASMGSDLDTMVVYNLLRAHTRLGPFIDADLRRQNLTSAQLNVLLALRGAGADGLRMGEIGRKLIVTKSNVTGLIDRLEGQGLVLRAEHRDRRATVIHLTDAGAALLKQTVPRHARSPFRTDAVLLREREEIPRSPAEQVETPTAPPRGASVMNGGGMRSPMGTAGGLARTYGLQRQFGDPAPQGPAPRITRAGMRRIAGYLKPYWVKWLVIGVFIGAGAGLAVLPPFCVRLILDRAIPQQQAGLLAALAAAMVALALAAGLIGVLQQSLTVRVGQGIMFDLRNQLYRHLQRMSLHFYTANRSGEILSRINNDVNAVQGVATETLVAIATNLATLTATSIAVFSMNWRLALLAVAVVPMFYLPSRIVGGVRRRLSAQTQATQADVLAFLSERLHVGGTLLTHIFGQRQADAEGFQDRSARLRDLNVKQTVVGRWLFLILSVFSVVGPALVYWYGGLQVMRKELTPGMLVAFAALLALLYRPLMQLATVYVNIQASFAVFDRIFEYLDKEPRVKDSPRPVPLPQTSGHIRFENVGFRYPPPAGAGSAGDEGNGAGGSATASRSSIFALRDVSFEIAPGQRVALVGPSGSGKTTITYLVPRFYDPASGRITVDGHDLRDLPQEELRRHIGMVTQETFLFHATIRENLLYARPGASDAQLVEACKAANIDEFIRALPNQYDTVAGERGFRLSGGERQRVSIARALLKDPAILVLDEATSSLDATSEYLIQSALEKLLRGRTSLIIAHRLSTILSCDKIIVMEGGRIVDAGRHEELMERRGLYARLYEQQFAKVLRLDHGDARSMSLR